MGRIKSVENHPSEVVHNLFSTGYRKLAEADNNLLNNQTKSSVHSAANIQLVQNLLRLKMSQDYVAYNCGQCGHHQRIDIKADELHSIVGDALQRMSCRNVVSTVTTAPTTSAPSVSQNQQQQTAIKNQVTWQRRQWHDKTRKSNNIEQLNSSKCPCAATNESTKPTMMKGALSGSSAFHPLMMGYKPLLTSHDLTDDVAKPCRSPSPSDCGSDDTYLPTLPVRIDSLSNSEEDDLLKSAPWFQAGIPREVCLEILQQEPIGSFLVRDSTSQPGCYALSVRVPKAGTQKGSIAHYLIMQSNRGFKIKGFTKEFPSLTSLIVHHSVMPELLPCPLLLHRPPADILADYNFVDIDSDTIVMLELTRTKNDN